MSDPRQRHGSLPGGGPTEKDGPRPPPDWQLWAGFLGAPTLWLLHFLLFYLAVERFCAVGGEEAFGRLALLAGTVLAAAAAAGWTLAALRLARRAGRTPPMYDDFLPRVGVMAAGMTVFILLLEAMPLLFVNVCG